MLIDNEINLCCKRNGFNGVVLIAKDNEIGFFQSFGYKDIDNKIELSNDTVFRIGSITKQFTAMAILQLVDRGKVELSDSISKYIKDVPYNQEITIHHLLSNCSGIPNFNPFADYSEYLNSDNFHREIVKNLIFKEPLNFTPGEKFEYSSSGYIILSYIIEILSNKTYSEFLKENIFDQLSMNSTGFCYKEIDIPGFASLYDVKEGKIEKAADIDMRIASGGGGLYSTAFDLFKWNQALLKSSLLPSRLQKEMFSVQTPINQTGGYGYGVVSVSLEIDGQTHKLIYHPGNGPGVYAQNNLIDENIQIIMLSNINDGITFKKCHKEVEDIVIKGML